MLHSIKLTNILLNVLIVIVFQNSIVHLKIHDRDYLHHSNLAFESFPLPIII